MFKPLNNRILVKPEAKPDTTTSGIFLSNKIEEKPVIGEVVVGNKDVSIGDRVLFSKFGYDELDIEGNLHYVVSDFNILGVL
jgi:chaperonin GroES